LFERLKILKAPTPLASHN